MQLELPMSLVNDEVDSLVEDIIRQVEYENNIYLNQEQKQAIQKFSKWLDDPSQKRFLLTGQAGTGKTTISQALIRYCNEMGYSYQVTALTHKAATVLSSKTGFHVMTLHSCFGLKPSFDERTGVEKFQQTQEGPKYKQGDIVFIDEASMINRELWKIVLRAILEHRIRVVLIADAYQLNPVKEKNCIALLGYDESNSAKLEKVERHDSAILELATHLCEIVKGQRKFFDLKEYHNPPEGIFHVDRRTFEDELFRKMKQVYGGNHQNPDEVKFLAWTNNEVNSMSTQIRRKALGIETDYPLAGDVMVFNQPWSNDPNKVIFNNNEEVTVHDVIVENLSISLEDGKLEVEGYHAVLDKKEKEYRVFVPKTLEERKNVIESLARIAGYYTKMAKTDHTYEQKRKQAWREYFKVKSLLADLRFPYTSTVHKSQGSTYNVVFIDIDDIGQNTHNDEIARLLYVAVSRAQYEVWMTGSLPSRLF